MKHSNYFLTRGYVRPTQSSSSTHHAPFETGSRKRSGLFVILYIIRLIFALCSKHSTRTDAPRTERQLQHPRMLLPRRMGWKASLGG
ncbi:hypothetical protein BDW62DRAFT_190489 [Aspergillus aurantiobrunneus]